MNCKQARSLFSSRLDGEMKRSETMKLQEHLGHCAACESRWESFESTVRMLRSLPPVTADPSFVGQVLDRVRGYEAGLEPLSTYPEERWSAARMTALVRDFLGTFSPGRLWTPVRFAGAVGLGVLVGFTLVNHNIGSAPGGRPGSTVQMSAGPVPARSMVTVASESPAPVGPFADLARALAAERRGTAVDTTSAAKNGKNDQVPDFLNPSQVGRQVHLDQPDGRPQIIF